MLYAAKTPVMSPFYKKLYSQMEKDLEQIRMEEVHSLQLSERSIRVVKHAMEQLQEYISGYDFKNRQEEIHFFKEVKPLFYSRFIYHLKIFRIEIRRPNGSNKTQEKYLFSELDRLKHFFDNNLEFYQYYRSGATYLDESYFLRNNHNIFSTLDANFFNNDPRFCTSHDFKVAKILANELVKIYLNTALEQLARKDDPPRLTQSAGISLFWTSPKAALIELLYALQSVGAFNNGAADIKQLASFFETVFQVDLGNFYHVFQEIRIRKKTRTSFLDLLKDKLIQRMDEADENYR